MRMKRIILFMFAILVFHIDTMAQTMTIEGNTFTLRLYDNDMTAEIYDSKFVIDDRPFPMNQKERKFNDIKAKKSQFLLSKSESEPVVVTIPSTYTASNGNVYDITVIGKAAFAGYKNVDKYIIPASVVTIDDYAFFRSSITSIEIPASVKKMGKRVFGYCDKLKDIRVPQGLHCDNDVYRESKKADVDYYLADNFTPLPRQGKKNIVTPKKAIAQKAVEQAANANTTSADSALAVADEEEAVPFEYVPFEGESTSNITSVVKVKTHIKTKNLLVKLIANKIMKKVDGRLSKNGTYLATTIQKGAKSKTISNFDNSITITEQTGNYIKTTIYYPYIKKGYYTTNNISDSQKQLEEMRKGTVEKIGETMIILGKKCELYRVKYEMKKDSAGTVTIMNLHNDFAVCKDPSIPGANIEYIPGVRGVPLKYINNTTSQTTSKELDMDYLMYLACTTTEIKSRPVNDSELEVPEDIDLFDADNPKNARKMLKMIDENKKYMIKNKLWKEEDPDEIKIYDNLQEDWEY